MARRGRPKKPGKRHPGGQLVQEPEGPSLAGWHRIREDAVKLGSNPLIATELGRLGYTGALTSVEVATGFRIAEIYGRYDRSIGRRRSIASPSYELGRGRDTAAVESEEARERAHGAARAFGALQAEIALCPRHVKSPLEELCVEDRICPPGWLPAVRIALGMLADALGIRRRIGRPKSISAPSKEGAKIDTLHPEKKINQEREAFIETVTRLGLVDPEDAAGVYGHFRALMEREKFRKNK
jgi:hypothetical protein